MLLGEPPRSGGDITFQLFGIPVRVHPFFWLIAVMLGIQGVDDPNNPITPVISLLIWVVAVFLSILIHELGHALAMRAYGIWPWITLYSFGGLASYNPADARRVGPLGQVLISAAGPGSQFLLVAALAVLLKSTGHQVIIATGGFIPLVVPGEPVISLGVTKLLFDLMLISVFWGVLNLVPVYPLDGGQIAREILVAVSPRHGIVQSLTLSIVAAVGVMAVGFSSGAIFLALMFGFLGYGSYTALQAYRNQRGW